MSEPVLSLVKDVPRDEIAAGRKREGDRAQRAVEGPVSKLPRELWEAHANHALAVYDRQATEAEARDAEHTWRSMTVTDAAGVAAKGEAEALMDIVRRRLRTLCYLEHLALGTLEAVRAQVELTTATAGEGKR